MLYIEKMQNDPFNTGKANNEVKKTLKGMLRKQSFTKATGNQDRLVTVCFGKTRQVVIPTDRIRKIKRQENHQFRKVTTKPRQLRTKRVLAENI